MPAIRGVTVCVGDWYAATLAVTLVRNLRHMTECWVVTSPDDHAVHEVVRSVPGARLSITNAFYRHGAIFNKGLALEEAGFGAMGRHGWILIHDADVLFPDSMPFDQLQPGRLYGARRRVLDDPTKWHPGFNWNEAPPLRDGGAIGFFQAAHADDSAIKDKRPWYDVSFAHAGGSDAFFMTHWPARNHTILPVEVLHLGPVDRHWFGCDPAAKDLMAKFVTENGWHRATKGLDPAAAARAGEVVHRVEVPGYAPSTYELPFVRRAAAGRTAPPRPADRRAP